VWKSRFNSKRNPQKPRTGHVQTDFKRKNRDNNGHKIDGFDRIYREISTFSARGIYNWNEAWEAEKGVLGVIGGVFREKTVGLADFDAFWGCYSHKFGDNWQQLHNRKLEKHSPDIFLSLQDRFAKTGDFPHSGQTLENQLWFQGNCLQIAQKVQKSGENGQKSLFFAPENPIFC